METIALSTLVTGAGEGHSVTLRGVTVTRKADSAMTGGAWSLLEYLAPPHFAGPGLHWHAETTEGFYVLDGTLSFVVGEQTITATAGTFVHMPVGVPHTFFNATAAPVRFLTVCSPGGFEQYFDDLAALAAANPTAPPDPDALAGLWAQYDIRHDPAPQE